MEIMVEGKILDYEWTDMSKEGYPLVFEEAIHGRVIIRETSSKSIIITIYASRCSRESSLSEINRYVW